MSSGSQAVHGAGRTVGRYSVVREIGRGGMASVYLARQRDLDRLVALKELRVFRSFDASLAQRFLREAKLAGSFSHPNVVTVHDYFEHDRVPYIAMEYLARGSLRPYVGRVTLAQAGGILEGLLAGLAYAERRGIVHRDIKPENLLVSDEGGLKIADFGIAKATNALEQSALLTATGTTVGTPNYIAPEQAMARQLGPWTDLYSAGMTAFELFVGRTPFGDTEEPMGIVLRQINEPAARVSDLAPRVDSWISDWVEWLVSKDPAERPQSAGEAWNALEEALIGLLGPRWRREAHLLRPGETPAGATPATVGLPPGAAVRQASFVGAALPGADPRLAATVPPLLPPTDERTAAPARRPRRFPIVLVAALGVAALLAVGALARYGGGESPTLSSPAGQDPATAPSQQTTSTAVAPKDAPGTTAPAAPENPPAASSPGGTLADQIAPARKLARDYERAASQVSKRVRSPDGPEARLYDALRRTARAYRTAAAAAERGDLAAYTAALSAAAAGRKAVSGALGNGLEGGSPPAAAPQNAPAPPPPPPPGPCSGDSSSDDPSDDECGS